jgi:hypothetical protein
MLQGLNRRLITGLSHRPAWGAGSAMDVSSSSQVQGPNALLSSYITCEDHNDDSCN